VTDGGAYGYAVHRVYADLNTGLLRVIATVFSSPPVGMQSVVISVSLCMFVCLSV